MRIAIVGLGLIGGSLARDVTALGHEVVACDEDGSVLRAARRAGIVAADAGQRLERATECEMCVIAVPVDAAVRLLGREAVPLSRFSVITDVGSTKRRIVRAAADAGLARRFVGGHPFAGDHRAGWRSSRPGMFVGARVFLTPTAATGRRALGAVTRLWREVGARTVITSARSHDRFMAAASHAPQVLSAALGRALRRERVAPGALGSGGRDVTRLAGSNPAVWVPILRDNADAVAPLLGGIARDLTAVAHAMERGDVGALRRWLAAANHWAAAGEERG